LTHTYHHISQTIIKNWIRNQVGDDWLNDFYLFIQGKVSFIDIENEKIIQSFYNMNNHRGQLLMLQIFIYSVLTIPLFKNPRSDIGCANLLLLTYYVRKDHLKKIRSTFLFT